MFRKWWFAYLICHPDLSLPLYRVYEAADRFVINAVEMEALLSVRSDD